MRPDFVNAANKAIHLAYPGIAVIPAQASGASDSMWYRVNGVDAYGASPADQGQRRIRPRPQRTRAPVQHRPRVVYFTSLFTDLSK
jgi:hypothetical protein